MTNKPQEIWIDALEFQQKGGWKEDTQFVHLMGSPYLISAGEPGIPVDDAVVRVLIPQKNRYRIWIRDRNWMRFHSPGRFEILVNGKGNGKILGAMPSDRWIWEIAGDYELDEGYCDISLHDLTGYFGRFASILLTTDMDYVPSPQIHKIQSERARIKGINIDTQFCEEYDVIVSGGGPGGVPAAIAAARMGKKTLLIHNRLVLGGNGSSEIGITFDGASVAHVNGRETGIAEEIRRLRDCDPKYLGDWTRAMEALVANESNLTVIYNSHVCGVDMQDEVTIKSVIAMDLHTLIKSKYTAKIFIDCTGDAWLGYYAGAKYRLGREGKYQHGESMAPDLADTLTMSGSLKSGNNPYFYDSGKEIKYKAPDWVPRLAENEEEFSRVIRGNGANLPFWLETPHEYDDVWDAEETRDALLLVALGYYDFIKNTWSKRELVKNYSFNLVSVMSGHRESRRLIGDYILTQNDATDGRKFEDVISYSGWMLDVHHPKGAYSGKEGTMYCARHVPIVNVPYRCIYSVNIKNLLFAGRNISATHIALGTLRVQNTIATLGQAAGTAAALCVEYNETPRELYEHHIHELQQTLIRNDQYIPGVKNEDENDPCLAAEVTASSFCKSEMFENMQGITGDYLPLDVPRCAVFNLSRKHDDIKQFFVKLSSTLDKPTTVTLHAQLIGNSLDTASAPGEVMTSQAIVYPQTSGWIKFPITVDLGTDNLMDRCFVIVWLEKAEGISWASVSNLSFYYKAGYLRDNGEWNMQGEKSFRISVEEPVEIPANCTPENVINGYSRIVDASNYEWVSDPEQSLPQWVELKFKKPTEINSVSVVFDTDLSNPGTCWTVKIPRVSKCVKAYEIEVYTNSGWVTVASVSENFMRKNTHYFNAVTVEKIRINVNDTWGDKSARITEIRAALEK